MLLNLVAGFQVGQREEGDDEIECIRSLHVSPLTCILDSRYLGLGMKNTVFYSLHAEFFLH